VKENAYAKLNLCLEIGGILPNGYHELKSVMQSVSLHDVVSVSESDGITVSCSSPRVPGGEKNLVFKAAVAFFETARLTGGAHIHIEKHIPASSGLGGGSTDAAAALRALNRLYGEALSAPQMEQILASLGADAPFCLRGGCAFASGTGTVLERLPVPKLHIVLCPHARGLSTSVMYRLFDESAERPKVNAPAMREAILKGNMEKIPSLVANSFLFLARKKRVHVEKAEKALWENGALSACISGKGPTVFGLFKDEKTARQCVEAEKIKGAIYCETVC